MSAQSIPVGPVEAKQIRERRVNESLAEVRRAVHDGEWALALSEVKSLSGELAAIIEADAAEEITTSKTIKAADLKEGYSVKAEGASAWSVIRKVTRSGPDVIAHLDWGRIAYDITEDVEIEAVSLRDGGKS